jgi:hypothetical protein
VGSDALDKKVKLMRSDGSILAIDRHFPPIRYFSDACRKVFD